MATRVRSYSKINLGLAIGPEREDGFHSLATLYQTLALHDVVTVEARRLGPGGATVVQLTAFGSWSGYGFGAGSVVEAGSGSGFGTDSGLARRASRISLTTNHAQVPVDVRNTAWRMVERALARMGVAAEVAIHIEKELPVQGGMGAGSANAAAALIGLERELGIVLSDAERLELAAEVGSDVPLFLVGGTVLGLGHGELVSAMPDLPATACVVALPEVGVSTPRAFQDWDELCQARASIALRSDGDDSVERGPGDSGDDGLPIAPELTGDPQPDRLEELSRVCASVFGGIPRAEQTPDTSGIVHGFSPVSKQGGLPGETLEQGSAWNGLAERTLLALVRAGIENDFEQVVFPQYPLLREIKRLLMGPLAGESSKGSPADSSGGALYAALSGSGSALFGLYRTEADAIAAQRRVQATGCKALLTGTLPRQEYWRKMFAE